MAVVVLPTPPFRLATTSTRSAGSDLTGTAEPSHASDAAARAALGHALHEVQVEAELAFSEYGQDDPRQARARAEVRPGPRVGLKSDQLGRIPGVARPEVRQAGGPHEVHHRVALGQHDAEPLQ